MDTGTIAGRIEQDIAKKVSHETIYMWIYRERPDLTQYLPRKQAGRKKRNYVNKSRKTHIPNRVDIDNRPNEANKREEFGHFEADCIRIQERRKQDSIVSNSRQVNSYGKN